MISSLTLNNNLRSVLMKIELEKTIKMAKEAAENVATLYR